jgi:hypothetical protein
MTLYAHPNSFLFTFWAVSAPLRFGTTSEGGSSSFGDADIGCHEVRKSLFEFSETVFQTSFPMSNGVVRLSKQFLGSV